MMAVAGDHFANLWFARRAENCPLADFHPAETSSHLHWAVRRIPIRKDNQGRDVNLANILEAFENTQLTRLKQAIDDQGWGRFRAAQQGEPHGPLLMPQGGGQAVSQASGADRTRVAHPELRPQGRLAALTTALHPDLWRLAPGAPRGM